MSRIKITLYQHAWKSKELDPDGCAFGTKAEAEAAEARCARDELDEFSADDIADAITEHVDADDIDDDRLAAIRAGADLTDAEAIMAAEEIRGYDSAIYPITVELDFATVAMEPNPFKGLEEGVGYAFGAVANWERGDLAGAVHALDGWAESMVEKFPDLECERPIRAGDLKPGDRVDMEDHLPDDPAAEFEYGCVIAVEVETPTCVRVDFENLTSFGFDPDTEVMTVRTAAQLAKYADLEPE